MTATPRPPTRIFVFNGSNEDLVDLGDVVTVTGNVGEYQGQTQISVTPRNVAVCGTGTVAPDRRDAADGERRRPSSATRACSCGSRRS